MSAPMVENGKAAEQPVLYLNAIQRRYRQGEAYHVPGEFIAAIGWR